jgi:hypothetical protein
MMRVRHTHAATRVVVVVVVVVVFVFVFVLHNAVQVPLLRPVWTTPGSLAHHSCSCSRFPSEVTGVHSTPTHAHTLVVTPV